MEKVTLAISLPGRMQVFFGKNLREGRFNTSSEYIRWLMRYDRDLNDGGHIVAIIRRLRDDSAPPGQDADVARTGLRANGTRSRPNWRRRISEGRDT